MSKRFAFVTAGIVAAVLAVGGIAGVAAQTADEADSGPLSGFVDRLAGKLGIGPDELKTAIEETRNEMIDEAVADGSITPERAEALKERALGEGLRDGKGFDFKWVGPRGEGDRPFHGRFGLGGGPFGGAFPEAADIIGIDVPTLIEEMQSGKTLAEVAADHGVSRQELKQGLLDEYSADLDGLLDRSFEFKLERRGGNPLDPSSTPTPSSTATPSGS